MKWPLQKKPWTVATCALIVVAISSMVVSLWFSMANKAQSFHLESQFAGTSKMDHQDWHFSRCNRFFHSVASFAVKDSEHKEDGFWVGSQDRTKSYLPIISFGASGKFLADLNETCLDQLLPWLALSLYICIYIYMRSPRYLWFRHKTLHFPSSQRQATNFPLSFKNVGLVSNSTVLNKNTPCNRLNKKGDQSWCIYIT